MSTRLERVVRWAMRTEFANHKRAAERQGLDAPTVALLEKTFVTNETFYKEIGALRSEMRTEFGAVRLDIHTEVSALRSEMHSEIGALRTELRTEVGALRADIAKIPFETIKWFFTLSGIIAAICFGALRLT